MLGTLYGMPVGMRASDGQAQRRLSELCAGLGAASSGHLAGLWQLSAAFYEAQADGLLQPDVYAKRVSSRLLAQLRLSIAGHTDVSDRPRRTCCFSARTRVRPMNSTRRRA